MDAGKLTRMANEIAHFYASEPSRAVAVEGVASHLKRFWEPRMRTQIFEILDAGGEGLLPLVIEALTEHRERLTPVVFTRGMPPATGS